MPDEIAVLDDAALLPALPTFALANPAVLRTNLQAYSDARAVLLRWLDENLTPGVDYMLIHRKVGYGANKKTCSKGKDRTNKQCDECGGKATLCKPGSEKLCGLLRLRPTFRRDQDTWEMLGREAGTLCIVCELVSESGEIIAEGRGCRKASTDYDDVNKSIKMVQKSAQTDAVLRVGGLSEVFTQDLEDQVPTLPAEDTLPRRLSAAPAASERPSADAADDWHGDPSDQPAGSPSRPAAPPDGAQLTLAAAPARVLTAAERKSLWALCQSHHVDKEDLRAYLKRTWDYDSTSQIRVDQVSQLGAWIAADPEVTGG